MFALSKKSHCSQKAGSETRTRKKALQEPHVANYITPAKKQTAGIEPTAKTYQVLMLTAYTTSVATLQLKIKNAKLKIYSAFLILVRKVDIQHLVGQLFA